MTPTVGSRFDSCDWRSYALVFGTVIAVDDRNVVLQVGAHRSKISAVSFPHERRGLFGRGARRDWRMISAG